MYISAVMDQRGVRFRNMLSVGVIFACLVAGGLAQLECPPPSSPTNATFLPDPEDCHSYYECSNGEPKHVTCPDDLVWNQTLLSCDFEWSTPCTTRLPAPAPAVEVVFELPTCPPPDPNGNGNVTFYPDDTDCHRYYECDNGVLRNRTCPDGLNWNPEKNVCDFEWNYPCGTERAALEEVPKLANMSCPPPDPLANATYYADPEDCHSYYECDHGEPVHVTCPDDLVWNQTLEACDYEWSTPCTTRLPAPAPAVEVVFELPTCPPPDPNGNGNVTFYPDDTDCHRYYECDNGVLRNRTCPDGLNWNPEKNVCDFEWSYPCGTERRHYVPRVLPVTSKLQGRKARLYTEKSMKLRAKHIYKLHKRHHL